MKQNAIAKRADQAKDNAQIARIGWDMEHRLGQRIRQLEQEEQAMLEGERGARLVTTKAQSLLNEGQKHLERMLFKHQANQQNLQTHFAFLRHRSGFADSGSEAGENLHQQQEEAGPLPGPTQDPVRAAAFRNGDEAPAQFSETPLSDDNATASELREDTIYLTHGLNSRQSEVEVGGGIIEQTKAINIVSQGRLNTDHSFRRDRLSTDRQGGTERLQTQRTVTEKAATNRFISEKYGTDKFSASGLAKDQDNLLLTGGSLMENEIRATKERNQKIRALSDVTSRHLGAGERSQRVWVHWGRLGVRQKSIIRIIEPSILRNQTVGTDHELSGVYRIRGWIGGDKFVGGVVGGVEKKQLCISLLSTAGDLFLEFDSQPRCKQWRFFFRQLVTLLNPEVIIDFPPPKRKYSPAPRIHRLMKEDLVYI